MKALTVQQPWAWAIVHGGKDVENRTQAWSHRGPLAIHAGMRVSQRGVDHELLRPEWATGKGYAHVDHGTAQLSYPPSGGDRGPHRLAAVMPLGAIIGVVDLVDVHLPDQSVPCCTSPWAEMQAGVHLVLEHPRPLTVPILCRGRLGLWDLTPEQEHQLVLECAIEGKV